MKIGVMVESFRAGLDGGLAAAARLGVDGVQMYAVAGETRFDNLNAQARKDLVKRLGDMGLEFSAICADFGGHGFEDADENVERVDNSKRVMDLGLDLGCAIVTTHIGTVPWEGDGATSHPRYSVIARACEELGRYGQSVGATFAIETGPEPAAVLGGMLAGIGLDSGIGVNFDPANLVMVIGEDIPAAVETLGPYIVHTHAKDGVKFDVPVDGASYREVRLGKGSVPWKDYLAALGGQGFDGYLTIEREVGDQPYEDIAEAVGFLRGLIG